MHVLFVEDNSLVADSLCWLIRSLGHTVRTARTAQEALALVKEWTPDVIVTDLELPDMDGYELAGLLRKDTDLGEVSIISLSAYADDPERRKQAGIEAHYQKPITIDQLRDMLTF